ncbi:MAG: LamG domain-containing protein, partial [Bacteroidota bacterium]
MLKHCTILSMFLVAIILLSCKKNEPATDTAAKEMKDLKVSGGFDWETSRDVTFQVASDNAAVISITSEASDIQYYTGFFNGLNGPFTVTVNIPSVIRQVRVNGILVTISGNAVSVNLSGLLKDGKVYLPHDIPTPGLIAAWHFDENGGTVAHDSAGGHHGAITGASWISGISGKALFFDGNTSQVQVPGAVFNPVGNAISFSCWFRLNAVGDKGTLVFQNLKYSVTIDAQGRVVFTLYTPGSKSLNSGTSNRILDTDWHHVALTYDGTIMKIVIDGLLRTYTSNTGNLLSSTADVYIGKQPTAGSFKGIIDEVLVYDRALTDNDILRIFGSTPAPGTGSDV